jgi:MipA family protein
MLQERLLQENDGAGNPVLPALICYSLNRSTVRKKVKDSPGVSLLKSSLRQTVFALALASAGSASLLGAGAFAADLPSIKEAAYLAPIPDWVVTVSGQVSGSPAYPGAKNYIVYGLPGLSIRRSDQAERFGLPDDGFGVALYDIDWFRAGPVGRWVSDRPRHGNSELVGMPYIAPSVEIGGFAELTPLPGIRLRAEVRQAVSGYDGLAATVSADIWHSFEGIVLSVGPRLYFGSDKYASTYFSVTPQQSAYNIANGGQLTPYNATGGLTALGVTAAARYDFNETWRATGYGNFQYLTNDVANSPIVRHDGSRDQYMIGLEISYRFHTPAWFSF